MCLSLSRPTLIFLNSQQPLQWMPCSSLLVIQEWMKRRKEAISKPSWQQECLPCSHLCPWGPLQGLEHMKNNKHLANNHSLCPSRTCLSTIRFLVSSPSTQPKEAPRQASNKHQKSLSKSYGSEVLASLSLAAALLGRALAPDPPKTSTRQRCGWTASRIRPRRSSKKGIKWAVPTPSLSSGPGVPPQHGLATLGQCFYIQLSIWKWKAEAKNKFQWNCWRLMGWKPQRIPAWGQGPRFWEIAHNQHQAGQSSVTSPGPLLRTALDVWPGPHNSAPGLPLPHVASNSFLRWKYRCNFMYIDLTYWTECLQGKKMVWGLNTTCCCLAKKKKNM